MAVAGRNPRPSDQKRNRVKSDVEWTEVVDVPFAGERPELASTRVIVTREGQEHVAIQSLTKAWWDVVSTMPHCGLWAESDWMFALSTAVVADAAFCGIASAQTELRNREKVLGTTAEFRRGLRIRYVERANDGPVDVEVTSLDDYRNL